MGGGRRLRIGAVSYLNTKPLVYRLSEFAPDVDVVYDVPSRLADRLASGHLDVGLVPSIESFQCAEYRIVSDACIACRGPVLSVKLFSRVPIEQVQSVALDAGSRTSAALVRILLQQLLGLSPEFCPLPLDADILSSTADAVLLIGDRAIRRPAEVYVAEWDLGQQWCAWTGLPFVFAMWTARRGADVARLEIALRAARDAGLANLESIAAREVPTAGLSTQECLTYLRDYLYFYLGPQERLGLRRFQQLAVDLGMAPGDRPFHRFGSSASWLPAYLTRP